MWESILLFASKFYSSSFPEIFKICQINQSSVAPIDTTDMIVAFADWYSIYIPLKISKFGIAEVLLTGAMQAARL